MLGLNGIDVLAKKAINLLKLMRKTKEFYLEINLVIR